MKLATDIDDVNHRVKIIVVETYEPAEAIADAAVLGLTARSCQNQWIVKSGKIIMKSMLSALNSLGRGV